MNSSGRPSAVTWFTGPQRDPVAVGERQPLVDPRAVGQARAVQFARREHHLPVLAVDEVAVVVDRHEVVVRADFLDLAERVQQRLVVPERHVLERERVAREVAPRQQGVPRQLPVRHLFQAVGLPRGRDVVDDEGRLLRLLVGRHDEALHERAVEAAAHGDDDVERHRRDDDQARTRERLDHRQRRPRAAPRRSGTQRGQLGVHVRSTTAPARPRSTTGTAGPARLSHAPNASIRNTADPSTARCRTARSLNCTPRLGSMPMPLDIA